MATKSKYPKMHTFCGVRYIIDVEPFTGWCDTSLPKVRAMRFPDGLSNDLESLDTEIHEALHACFPNLGEDRIKQSVEDLSRFLWRMGYRRKKRWLK